MKLYFKFIIQIVNVFVFFFVNIDHCNYFIYPFHNTLTYPELYIYFDRHWHPVIMNHPWITHTFNQPSDTHPPTPTQFSPPQPLLHLNNIGLVAEEEIKIEYDIQYIQGVGDTRRFVCCSIVLGHNGCRFFYILFTIVNLHRWIRFRLLHQSNVLVCNWINTKLMGVRVRGGVLRIDRDQCAD